MNEYVNVIEVAGSIVDVFYRENFVAVKLSTSKNGVVPADGKRLRNYPRIIWYGDEAKRISNTYKKGDRVQITAEIETHFIPGKDDGKRTKRQTILGKTIDFAKTNCEEYFGVDSAVSNYIPDVNTAKFKGEVTSVFAPDESRSFAKVTLKIIHNNRFSYPEILFFGRLADFVTKNVKSGDMICIAATIQTYRKESPDGDRRKTEYTENLVANEVALQ